MTTSIAPPPLDDLVSLADVEFFMSYPFDVFARMRAEAPVYWSENGSGVGAHQVRGHPLRLEVARPVLQPVRPDRATMPHPG